MTDQIDKHWGPFPDFYRFSFWMKILRVFCVFVKDDDFVTWKDNVQPIEGANIFYRSSSVGLPQDTVDLRGPYGRNTKQNKILKSSSNTVFARQNYPEVAYHPEAHDIIHFTSGFPPNLAAFHNSVSAWWVQLVCTNALPVLVLVCWFQFKCQI